MRKAWAGLVFALLAGAAYGATMVGESGAPVALSGHVLPALSDARVARSLAPRSAGAAAETLTLTIVLRRNDPAGFERYLAEVYDARGPRYRQFLSAQELSDRFGPFADDYAAVRAFCLTNANLRATEQSARFEHNINRILRQARDPGPYIYGVYDGHIKRLWPSRPAAPRPHR